MIVQSVIRKGTHNTRVKLADGNTTLVPTDIADSLVGKECPKEYLDKGTKPATVRSTKTSGAPKASVQAEKPQAAASPTIDVEPVPPGAPEGFQEI